MTAELSPRFDNRLTAEDRLRLERLAPALDIHYQRGASTVALTVLDIDGWRTSVIPSKRLHARLLAEICSKVLRWVYFPLGRPCTEALLGLTDKRLDRIAQLYSQQRHTTMGLPELAWQEPASPAALADVSQVDEAADLDALFEHQDAEHA